MNKLPVTWFALGGSVFPALERVGPEVVADYTAVVERGNGRCKSVEVSSGHARED